MSADTENDDSGSRFIVLWNDDRNTFDHVARHLRAHIPGISKDVAWNMAMAVHDNGKEVVWKGPFDRANRIAHALGHHGLLVSLEVSNQDLVTPEYVAPPRQLGKSGKIYDSLLLATLIAIVVLVLLFH
jgi:ATP-dependent Clp protease adapter protein ClpS